MKENTRELMRRVQGQHDLRLDGMYDLLTRAQGASVFDIGSNRGHACWEFYNNGASRLYGCDYYEDGIAVSRHNFIDKRDCTFRFEVVDLTEGEAAIRKAFGKDADLKHDIVLMLATYHKLDRIKQLDLSKLMQYFGAHTAKYFAWRGYEHEMKQLDVDLGKTGLVRIHTSMISDIQPAAIWGRKK